jgi:hypothetical protein
MPPLPPLVNGRSYGWADITTSPAGIPLFGIRSIEYTESQDMENIYGAGNRPVSRGYGRITYTGSITLLMEDLEKLQAASPGGRIQDILEFPIVVSYAPETGIIVVHKLQYCRFKNNGRVINEGDMSIETKIELIIGNISWG